MADITKYAPINGSNLISEFKTHFSIFRTKTPVAIGFAFVFIAFTIFLVFIPSSNPSSTIFPQVFITNATTSSSFSDRSHISSIFGYFFSNSSSTQPQNSSLPNHGESQDKPSSKEENHGKSAEETHKDEVLKANQTQIAESSSGSVNSSANGEKRIAEIGTVKNLTSNLSSKVENHTKNEEKTHKDEPFKEFYHKDEVLKANQTEFSSGAENSSAYGEKGVAEIGAVKNLTSNLMKKQNQDFYDLMKCDFFEGNWVRDDSYPLYQPNSCSLIDEQFNCFFNGRPDSGYYKLKWKPKGCTLPRLNGSHMLEMLRGKRLVFVGDSLNRNMWESLICILRNSVKDQKKVYEASGKQQFRSEVSYSFVFQDYNLTVEFFVTPFLVQEWEVSDKNGTKKETLRLDLMSKFADQYKTADVIVYNTGHWWTHDKTSKGKDYYQEGSHVYDELNVEEAFRKAMTTWGRWIDSEVDPKKSLVLFRGYSASHFSGGQWNSGGQCDNETEPITNDAYLSQYPSKMAILENVIRGMKTRVTYMNVTRMTDYRKDGHPSMYRKQNSFDLMVQDCSHWCLPGVPDIWNEILYAELLVKLHKRSDLQMNK